MATKPSIPFHITLFLFLLSLALLVTLLSLFSPGRSPVQRGPASLLPDTSEQFALLKELEKAGQGQVNPSIRDSGSLYALSSFAIPFLAQKSPRSPAGSLRQSYRAYDAYHRLCRSLCRPTTRSR